MYFLLIDSLEGSSGEGREVGIIWEREEGEGREGEIRESSWI